MHKKTDMKNRIINATKYIKLAKVLSPIRSCSHIISRNIIAQCSYKKTKNTKHIIIFGDESSKICMDCKFYMPYLDYHNIDERMQYGLCKHPSSTEIDVITGETYHSYAYEMRENKKQCGPEGNFYVKDHTIWIILRTIRTYINVRKILSALAILCIWIFIIALASLSRK